MGILDDLGSQPLGIAEDFWNKGWLVYIIIGLIGIALYLIFWIN